MRHQIARDGLRIDEVGHAKALAPFGLAVIDVDADDFVGANHLQALDDVEADPAQPEDDGIGARLDPGRIDHGADPGGHAAADIAGLVERGVVADLG